MIETQEKQTEAILPEDIKTKTFQIGSDTFTFETGKLARSASGSVTITSGDTMIMCVATGSEKPRSGIDFFPLLIDVEEKMYAVGRLPGGYLKREGRPSEKATLTARLIDRPIRPLFPDGYRNDVQVIAHTLSTDSTIQTDVISMVGASMALVLSGLPFGGPIGAVRIGRINGEFVVNPSYEQQEESNMDLIVSGTASSIMMVEAGCDFVTEEDLLAALDLAHSEIKKQVAIQEEFAKECGVVREEFVPEFDVSELNTFALETVKDDVHQAYHQFDRDTRKEIITKAKEKLEAAIEALADDHAIKQLIASSDLNFVADAFKKAEKKVMRAMVTEEGVRADGRQPDEIRPITCEVGVVPRVHGSALFTRGTTQALSITTLGAPGDAQRLDGVDPATEKRWLHHYAFPAYSVGEVRPMRGPGRREIGHGALAERANFFALPTKEDFAYTLRVNSEILASNGSTSMAATCGTSMALMDAGVPVKCPIGGIAMGLIKEGDKSVVLSDIQGLEDFLGDMDFKVTGNKEGVTALQMDIKIQGISLDIMKSALEQARVGRIHILDKMAQAISEPRAQMSEWAPRIISFNIKPDLIGAVIGPGGKMIRSIIEETGVQIDIEDSGLVTITSDKGGDAEKAQKIVQDLTLEIERGMIFKGTVVRIIPIGAFVELVPGKDGMVHISQIANYRVNNVEDELSVGDEVPVLVKDVDDRGRINLTIKGLANEEREKLGFPPLEKPEPRPPRNDGDGGGGGKPDKGAKTY